MMAQEQFELAGFPVTVYWLLFLAGALVILPLGAWLMRARGFPLATALDCWFVTIIGAFLSSRLYAALGFTGVTYPEGTPYLVRLTDSGASAMGAVPVLVVVMLLLARWHPALRQDRISAIDSFPVCFAVFDGIGRLGCFAAGCCHGKPAFGVPWAVVFDHPESACVYQGIPVHPTQLYHSAGALVLAGGLFALWRRPAFRGTVLWAWLAGYGVLRLVVEFWRADVHSFIGQLSSVQWVCVAFIGTGAIFFRHQVSLNRKSSAKPEPMPALSPRLQPQ